MCNYTKFVSKLIWVRNKEAALFNHLLDTISALFCPYSSPDRGLVWAVYANEPYARNTSLRSPPASRDVVENLTTHVARHCDVMRDEFFMTTALLLMATTSIAAYMERPTHHPTDRKTILITARSKTLQEEHGSV